MKDKEASMLAMGFAWLLIGVFALVAYCLLVT